MAKHKCPEPPPDTGRWMGTYGDMVTLLMAFFVMLFAVSETDNQKFEAFVAGLAGPFDNPAVELGLVEGSSTGQSSMSPLELIAPMAPGQAELLDRDAQEQFALTVQEAAEIEAERRQQAQLDGVEEQLEESLSLVEVPISADLRDSERGLVIAISTDDVLFATGSAELSTVGRDIIAVLAPTLVDAPNTIVVEGHTDDRPLNAAGYTNWNLSTDRAVAVVQLLGDEHGLAYERVSAAGYADNRPLVPNDSEANRSTNRRVEILVVGLEIEVDDVEAEILAAQEEAAPAEEPTLSAGADTDTGEAISPVTDPLGQPLASIFGQAAN